MATSFGAFEKSVTPKTPLEKLAFEIEECSHHVNSIVLQISFFFCEEKRQFFQVFFLSRMARGNPGFCRFF